MTYDLSPDKPNPPLDGEAPLPGDPPRRKVQSKPDLDADCACVNCGYNLRGLPSNRRCPECGTPSAASKAVGLGGDTLYVASTAWLSKMRNGTGLLLIAVVISVMDGLASGLMGVSGLALCVVLLELWAVWLMTTPEPNTTLTPAAADLREWVRRAAMISCAGMFIILLDAIPLPVLLEVALNILAIAARIAVVLGLGFYLRKIATRLSDADLERRTTQVVYGLAISLAVLLVFGTLTELIGIRRSVGPAVCLTIVGFLGYVVYSWWYILVIYQFYETFKWAVHEAERRAEAPEFDDGGWQEVT